MQENPLEKLQSLGFIFWKSNNKRKSDKKSQSHLSLIKISNNHFVLNRPGNLNRNQAKKIDLFIRYLSISLGGDEPIEEIESFGSDLGDKELIIFGDAKEVLKEDIEKLFKKVFKFKSLIQILNEGSEKEDIWDKISAN
ncbi:MAG: hypothetical protein ACJ0F4_02710 [Gammaproteobacteria bacterium]